MRPSEARAALAAVAKKRAGHPQLAAAEFRAFVKAEPSHLLSALHVWTRAFGGSFEEGRLSPFEK